ncbi:MAG: hypothetical protein HYU39_06340 [Thaumarchaeota archaeon]|nr:hypothetical protein [Nitrososphaerota archaeon]
MSASLLVFPLLAFALGVKHAYDADHLVAVSNFLTRSKGIRDTSRMTLSWAIGHMFTAAIITVILFTVVTQVEAVTTILNQFENMVAFMLIAIGAIGIIMGFRAPTVHEHPHTHPGGIVHSHPHSHRFGRLGRIASKTHLHHPLLGVGIIHGLASNDELLFLFVAGLGVGSLELLLGGVAVFTIGVVLGMVIFGVLVTYPVLKYGMGRVQLVLNVVVGALSIAYGLMILYGIGGFNPFELLAPQ